MAETPRPTAQGQAPQSPQKPQQPPQKPDLLAPIRTTRFWVTLAILFAANILLSNLFFNANQPPTVTISYNTFLQQVTNNNVSSITSTGETITGVAKSPVKDQSTNQTSTKFQTQRPAFANDNLETLLTDHNVIIEPANLTEMT